MCFITYILNLIDLIISEHLVSLYGIDVELNPLMSLMQSTNIMLCIKTIVMALLFYFINYEVKKGNRVAKFCSEICFAVYIALVIYELALLVLIYL